MHISMRISSIIFFVCVFYCAIGSLAAVVPYPNSPLQYTANVNSSIHGEFPSVTTGVLYYDALYQRLREDTNWNGGIRSEVNDFVYMVSYDWDTTGNCDYNALGGTLSPLYIPYGATYSGTSVIGSTPVNVWNLNSPILSHWEKVTYYVDSNNYTIRIDLQARGGATNTTIEYWNITVGQPDPQLFQPPSFCNFPPPNPPPIIKPCPISPDSYCQCVNSSQLKFCTAVNYPVSASYDAHKVDVFAAVAYLEAISTLSNPSQLCKDNIKSYICSYYFEICSSDSKTLTGNTKMPCQNMCPQCSCGDLVSANCTYAAIGPCTQYDKAFC